MRKRTISMLLAVCLLFISSTISAEAADTFAYTISATTTEPKIGSEFDVVISMTNYDSVESEIRGLQIDVTNIDPDVFEVVSHESLITDESAASNTTSCSEENHYIRLVYLRMSGAMPKTVIDVMKFRLKVKSEITESGSITLPVSFRIGTMDENIILNDMLAIKYTTEPQTDEAVKLDISWGDMQFVFNEGNWDTVTHKRIGGGWQPETESSNVIKVKNTGNKDVTISMSYAPTEGYATLHGDFTDSSAKVVSSETLSADGVEKEYWFHLSGTTSARWSDNYVIVGSITLTVS